MTRGRTGSTAIIDILNKTQSIRTAEQEPFLKHNFPNIVKKYPNLKNYPSSIPFGLWKNQKPKWWRFLAYCSNDAWLIKRYLKEIENAALTDGVSAFGFKILSNNFEEIPWLKDILIKRRYRVIYLKRNIPHQVISGMIAKQRGVYNINQDYKDDNRYKIDIEEFKNLMVWEMSQGDNDIAFLNAAGFSFIAVTYEEFMSDRQAFFNRLFGFLEVPLELPKNSSYSVMIKDLKYTVENFQEVVDCAVEMGMSIE
jgi:LPS sulfotransferase NodH